MEALRALVALMWGSTPPTDADVEHFASSGWIQKLEDYGIKWDEIRPAVERARRDPALSSLSGGKFADLVLGWLVDKKRAEYAVLHKIVKSWNGKEPTRKQNLALLETVSKMKLATPAFNPRHERFNKRELPLAKLNDHRLAANRRALLNAVGNDAALANTIRRFALTAANLKGQGNVGNLTRDRALLARQVQAVTNSLLQNGFDPDQLDDLLDSMLIDMGQVQAEAAALGLDIGNENDLNFAKRTALRKMIRGYRDLEGKGFRPNIPNSEKVRGRIPPSTLMWAKLLANFDDDKKRAKVHQLAQEAGFLGDNNVPFDQLSPLRSRRNKLALNAEMESAVQQQVNRRTHQGQATPLNPLGRPGARHPGKPANNAPPNLAGWGNNNNSNNGNLNKQQRTLASSLFGGNNSAMIGANKANNSPPSLASLMGMGVGVDGDYYNANGSFRFANSIRQANAPTGDLNRAQYDDLLRHMVVTCNHYKAGSLNVDFHFASNETLRQARVALYKEIQHKIFEKHDVLRKMCGDGVSSDDSAYKMLMRMGRITGEEKVSPQGAQQQGAAKPAGVLSVTLLPKHAGRTKGALKATAQLYPYPASLGQPNARLGVIAWLPLIVRFLQAGDQQSARAAHVFSRLAVCNRMPHFPVVYGVGMATRSTGKKAIMVVQEAVHGTLSDWLRDKSPSVPMVALALTQVLLALAAVHGRGMQHGALTASSVQFLRSRHASAKAGQWSQYRVGNRDIYLVRSGDLFLLDTLAPSIRRRVGPTARHCEVAQVIRMFRSALVAGGAGGQYKQLMAMVSRNRPDAVMFLHNPETVALLQSLSARLVTMGSGKKVAVGRAYAFDVVPKGYKPYTGSPKAVCEGASLFTKVRAALNQL